MGVRHTAHSPDAPYSRDKSMIKKEKGFSWTAVECRQLRAALASEPNTETVDWSDVAIKMKGVRSAKQVGGRGGPVHMPSDTAVL